MNQGWVRLKAVIFCFLFFFGMEVQALTPAQSLVEKMAESAKTISYKGYFAYDRGQQSSGYYFVHLALGDADRQRLVFLDGEPMEIINNGHSFTCIHPGDKGIHSDHGHSVDAFLKLSRSLPSIWQNYEAEITGEGRIANRPVVRVELKPNDAHRYPFVFFMDKQTGLMLKMLILDNMGRPLERFHYVMVDYDNVSESDLKPSISNYSSVEHSETVQVDVDQLGQLPWKLTWVPPGFQRENKQMESWHAAVHHELSYMYSDGLSAFSVFVEHTDQPARAGTSKRMGSTSAITHYVSNGSNVYLVTVVGEIPLMTAKQIAMSVRPST